MCGVMRCDVKYVSLYCTHAAVVLHVDCLEYRGHLSFHRRSMIVWHLDAAFLGDRHSPDIEIDPHTHNVDSR